MLRAYSKNITVTSGNAIPFMIDKLAIGRQIQHTSGTGNIVVHSPGFYQVNFDISFTSTTTDEAINIQLFANGVAIPDAFISTTITSGQTANCSFTTIIRALPGTPSQDVTLTVVPTADLTITSVAVGVDQ